MPYTNLKIKCFFDYFSVLTNSIDEDFLKIHCKELQYKDKKHGYRNARRFYCSFANFIVFEDCINDSYWYYKIQLHQVRKFQTLSEIESALALIMGFIDDRNHILNRIDLGFAVHESVISPQLLHISSHLKWKNASSTYNNIRHDYKDGELTGVHSSGSGVRQSYYTENGKPPKRQKPEYADELKMETQLRGKHLGAKAIYSIYDLYRLKSTNFLDRIAFYNILWIDKTKAKKLNIRKFKRFQEKALMTGFHNARRSFNGQGNYDRDYKKLFLPLCVGKKQTPLCDIFKKKFFKWFESWSKGVNRPLLSQKSWATIRPVHYVEREGNKKDGH
jgi:hypothetical protein